MRRMAKIKNSKKVTKPAGRAKDDGDFMAAPRYMDESLGIISAALKSGCDVLQLGNGDIVTTGTKTIVTTYRWNGKSGKMIKVSSKETVGANAVGPLLVDVAAKGTRAAKRPKIKARRK